MNSELDSEINGEIDKSVIIMEDFSIWTMY